MIDECPAAAGDGPREKLEVAAVAWAVVRGAWRCVVRKTPLG